MKRWWVSVLYIIVGVSAFIWLVKVPILSYVLSKELRLPVFIEWVSIWPHETTIREFKIENPKGFSEKSNALQAKKTVISYQVETVLANPSIIDEIALHTVFLSVEFVPPGGSTNNWTSISDHMSKKIGSHAVGIRHLVVTDLEIEIQGLSNQTIHKHVDHLEWDNISSQHGFPTEELIHKIFGDSGLGQYIQGAFNPLGLIEDVVDPIHIFE